MKMGLTKACLTCLRPLLACAAALIAGGATRGAEFFDDFSYVGTGDPNNPSPPEFACQGWYMRSGGGGPGPTGVTWKPEYVTWADDAAVPDNRIMRLRATTGGSGETTYQSEVGTQDSLFLDGTYGARMRFAEPFPSAQQPTVQAFTTYKGLLCDLNYSECDIEYTLLDPWSTRCGSLPSLHFQTWEQYCDNPLVYDAMPSQPAPVCGSLSGWHLYTIQMSGGAVRYYVDGMLKASHGGEYYPETPMHILLLHWVSATFSPGVAADYSMEIDWIYHAPDVALTSAEVQTIVEQFRATGVLRRNTMKAFPDCNQNLTPDWCEPDADGDGVIDACDTDHVWRVKSDATGANTGLTWTNAFTDLSTALTAAAPGDEIWVAVGTYRPAPPGGDRNTSFPLKSGVAVYGGFGGTETRRDQRTGSAWQTILSGDLNADDATTGTGENSYVVVNASNTDSSTLLDAFLITGANGTNGGGLYATAGNLTISNCVFRQNVASNGGAACLENSDAVFSRCWFLDNSAAFDGGALYANLGSDPRLIACVFAGNTANYAGGAARILMSTPDFISCIFRHNSAPYGGAVQNYESSGPLFVNCTFSGNEAQMMGGAVQSNNSTPILVNCTVTINTAVEGGGLHGWLPSMAIVSNSILWGNLDLTGASEAAQVTTATTAVAYSCVQAWTGVVQATGVTAADPLLVDPDGLDNIPGTEDDMLRLKKGSPCIDAGENAMLPPDVADLDSDGNLTESTSLDGAGYWRAEDDPASTDMGSGDAPIVDMGAFEYAVTVAPDLDFDRDVDSSDLVLFKACASRSGVPQTRPACFGADFDGDDDVDLDDFGLLQACISSDGQPVNFGCVNRP